MTTEATIHTLPTPGALPDGAVYRRTSEQGGEFIVQVAVTGGGRYPLKGGQGDYQPRNVLLVWFTTDGIEWLFRHAIITGQQIEKRTGEPGMFTTSQTIYLSDPTYRDCEPAWLAELVKQTAPSGAA